MARGPKGWVGGLAMLTALLYGVLASSGLLVGVAIGLVTDPPRRLVAGVVAFGSGVLVSALTFELMEEAFAEGSPAFTIGGFLLGALIYVVADVLLERMAAHSPRREGRDPQDVVAGAPQIPETTEQATVSGLADLGDAGARGGRHPGDAGRHHDAGSLPERGTARRPGHRGRLRLCLPAVPPGHVALLGVASRFKDIDHYPQPGHCQRSRHGSIRTPTC